jgi:hypothetical protein
VAFADLVRAAESGDADAIEGLLSLALSPDEGDSPLSQQALATLEADVKDAYAGFNAELKQDWVLAGGKLVKKS